MGDMNLVLKYFSINRTLDPDPHFSRGGFVLSLGSDMSIGVLEIDQPHTSALL